nr:ABC transporter substrate-binding protein [Geodermatophilus sabuli]
MVAAAAEGFFADEGLEVSFESTTSSRAQMQQLTSGDVDVAQTAADNVIGLAAAGRGGARIVHVADLGIDQMVVARAGLGSWADVRGGRVAVDAADSGYAYVLYSLLEDQGISRAEYQLLPVGGPAPRFQQLCSGTADVGLLNPHLASRALAEGLSVIARAADSFPGYPNLVVATSAAAAVDRRAELAAYCRAVDRAVAWAHDPAHADRATELLMEARACGAEEARALYESERSLRSTPRPSAEDVRTGLELVAELRERMGGGRVPLSGYFAPVVGAA